MKNMKLWDWVVWNQRLKWKIIEYFMPSKKMPSFFFSCVCIKWFKSGKKNIKMWSWNYWQRKILLGK